MKKTAWSLLLSITIIVSAYCQNYKLIQTIGTPPLTGSYFESISIDKNEKGYYLSDTYMYQIDMKGNILKRVSLLDIPVYEGWGSGAINYMTLDREGNIFVAVQSGFVGKFDKELNLVTRFPIRQIQSDYFEPSGIALNSKGNIYISSRTFNNIRIFNPAGTLIDSIQPGNPTLSNQSFYNISIDKNDNLYLVDAGSNRIQKLDSTGQLVMEIKMKDYNSSIAGGIALDSLDNIYVDDWLGTSGHYVYKFDKQGNLIKKIGSKGFTPGEFINPYGLFVDNKGFLYVADVGNKRIQKFDLSGTLISIIGSSNKEDGNFRNPMGITLDGEENIYVVDNANYRIQKFDKAGKFLMKFGEYGDTAGKFNSISDIALDIGENMYVLDGSSNVIHKFDKSGNFSHNISSPGPNNQGFTQPFHLDIDKYDNLYISNTWSNHIQKYDTRGNFISLFGKAGEMDGEFREPRGIATDFLGNIYVVDKQNYRIQKFDKNGKFISSIGKMGTKDGELSSPNALAVDGKGYLYVTDRGRVQIFDTEGKFSSKIDFYSSYNEPYSLSGIAVNLQGTKIIISNSSLSLIQIFSNEVFTNIITGKIYNDQNKECKKDSSETSMQGIIVKATPGNFLGITNKKGDYFIQADTGTYFIEQVLLPNTLTKSITQICPESFYKIEIKKEGTVIGNINFGNAVTYLPFLETKVSSNRRRRCLTNTTTVIYANSGFSKSENAKVYVKLPEYVIFKSADKTFIRDKEGNYVFDVGILEPNQSGTITILDSVACERNIGGLTQCTKVWITPSNPKEISPSWDKSDIFLSGKCQDNGFVRMGIYNRGNGNMKDSLEYRIFINAQLSLKKKFKLNQNDSLILRIPANGRTIRLEADEPKEHPSKISTNLTIENCGTSPNTPPSLGYVTKLPQDDSEPEVSISCLPIVDSYDPNDKIVEPEGTSSNHYTPTDAELKYLIRFQNTGTDTTYTVTVIDTLSENLDIATLQLGSSSHKYSFNLSGKGKPVLTWTFNKINLPDSAKNSRASNGFVAFSIKPKTGLAEKTKIENNADIIFDFNDPVRTNTTFNTIYDVPLTIDNAVKLDEKTIIIPKPVIISFSPSKARIGETITLKGKYFDAVVSNNTLTINTVKAILDSGNDSTLVFKVPTGAATGKITVQNTAGSVTSTTDLVILFPPVISSFSPQTGVPGDKVTISGSNFETDKTKNTVKFGNVQAEVISSTVTSLEVKVPGGFVNEKISVSTTVGDAISAASFTMSPMATENIPENEIKIYPNPTSGLFTIDFSETALSVKEIAVLNGIGQKVYFLKTDKQQKAEITLNNSGLYFIHIKTNNLNIIKKLVVQ